MPIDLVNSLPKMTGEDLQTLERHLDCKLPEDYAAFLLKCNGGEANPDFDYVFSVPIEQTELDKKIDHIRDSVEEFFGYLAQDAALEDFEGPNFLLGMNETYELEGFLPRGVIAIGLTATHSILCVSLREEDFGSIYYWYYNWHQPWAKEHFEKKIEAVQSSIKNFDSIVEKGEGEEFEQVRDKVNYATLTRLADSYTGFLGILEKVSYDDDDFDLGGL